MPSALSPGLAAVHLRRLRQRPGRSLLPVAGVAVAVALVVAVFGFHHSLAGSVEDAVRAVAGRADLELLAPADSSGGIDAGLADEVASVGGVVATAPIVFTTVFAGDRRAVLVAGDERALHFTGAFTGRVVGEAPSPQTTGVVVGEGMGVAPGDTVVIWAAGQAREVVVSSVAVGPDARRLNDGQFLATTMGKAQDILGRSNAVDTVLVDVDDGAPLAQVRRDVAAVVEDRAAVGLPRERIGRATAISDNVGQALTFGAALATIVAGFLIYNTVAMAAAERRRELATLRALGGTRRVLLRGFVAEAVVVGVAGAVAGALLGVVTARSLVEQLPDSLVATIGMEVRFQLPVLALVVGPLVGVAAAVAATVPAAWRAVRVAPVEAMRPEGTAPVDGAEGTRVNWALLVAGVAAIAIATPVSVARPEVLWLFVGVGIAFLGGMAIVRALSPVLVASAARVATTFGSTGRLAAAAIERHPGRVWATSAAVLLALALVVGQTGIVGNVRAQAVDDFAVLADIDLAVQTGPPEQISADVLLPAEWVGDFAAIDGVSEVAPLDFSFVTVDGSRVLFEGVSSGTQAPVLLAAPEEDQRRVLDGRGVIVTSTYADIHGAQEGDMLVVPAAGGARRFPIVEVADVVLWPDGAVIIGLDAMQEMFGRTGASVIEIYYAAGADKTQVREEVAQLVSKAPFPVGIYTGEEVLAGARKSVDDAAAALVAMQWVIVGAAGLSVLNTMLLSVLDRRRELGILRAIGATRRVIGRAIAVEAIAITVVGAVIGVVYGFYFHYLGVGIVDDLQGVPVDFQLSAFPVALAVAAAALVAAAGAWVPGRRAARVAVVEAIGYE